MTLSADPRYTEFLSAEQEATSGKLSAEACARGFPPEAQVILQYRLPGCGGLIVETDHQVFGLKKAQSNMVAQSEVESTVSRQL
jgi:hypothetical protein